MDKQYPVSVIMAEFNTNPKYLEESIKSILGQSFINFEFIIVDDGGSNKLSEVKRKLGNDSRIRIISNIGNKGFVYSLNNAIKHAKGEYLVRMDTDDIATKQRIERLYSYIKTHPEYSVISSKAMEFSEKEEFGTIGKPGEKTKKDIMRGDTPVHAASIMKKSDIEDIHGYKDFNRAEDLVLWCDLLLAGKRLYVLDDTLYKYRVDRKDYKKRTLRHRKGELRARILYYPKLGAGPIEYLRIIKSVIAGMLPVRIIQIYRNNFIVEKD